MLIGLIIGAAGFGMPRGYLSRGRRGAGRIHRAGSWNSQRDPQTGSVIGVAILATMIATGAFLPDSTLQSQRHQLYSSPPQHS